MTDGDDADIELGTTLPVPPALDGHSTTSEGGDGTGDKSLEGNDADNFSTAESPLWAEEAEELPDESNAKAVFPGEHDSHTLAQGMDHRDGGKDMRNQSLSEAESRALDSMVNQAMLSASLDDGLQLPWEVGVMASIFGDAPLASMPSIPDLAHNMEDKRVVPSQEFASLGEPQTKRQRVLNSTLRVYERAIQFRNVLTDHDADEIKWSRALEKLYAIMASSPGAVPRVCDSRRATWTST